MQRYVCILLALLAFVQLVYATNQRYESIDHQTQAIYTAHWTTLHSSWIGINEDLKVCDDSTQTTTYPLCIDDYTIRETYLDYELLGDQRCPAAMCVAQAPSDASCSATPFDSIDYIPPAATTSLDNTTICRAPDGFSDEDPFISAASYGLDLGIPPFYLPIVPVRLNITGTVRSFSFEDECIPIANAEIVAWHVDPTALVPFTEEAQFRHWLDAAAAKEATERGTPFSRTTTGGVPTDTPQTDLLIPRNHSLRDVSCRATQHTDEQGGYEFMTLMPPSYGPPRHVMFQVSALGYETLTTRMYFDRDWRLQQLAALDGDDSSDSPHGHFSRLMALGLTAQIDTNKAHFPSTPVTKDPRVAKLRFRSTGATGEPSLVAGILEAEFHIVLSPTWERLVEATTAISADGATAFLTSAAASRDVSGMPPVDLRGLWADAQGALVRVESHGPSVLFHEYPHPRTWGSAMGMLQGGNIRGVDFHQVLTAEDVDNAQKQRNNPMVDFNPSSTTWTAAGVSTGVIVPADPFATTAFDPQNPLAASIQWSGGGYQNLWTKLPDDGTGQLGYRYLKLLVSRESGGVPGGSLILNEIEFFQGALAQDQRPMEGFKMTTPRYPPPQAVSCSSFRDQDTHCFRAFDGDLSSRSAWVTKPVGSRRHQLSAVQWVTFDFGAGRAVSPTAMRIVCDAANAAHTAAGCPMSFALLGSHDNLKFDRLFREDLFDYDRDYRQGGKMFYFLFETVRGRINGQRCGSCSSGPAFTCSLDAYDGTCDSRYCGQSGLCSPEPVCPPGEYMHYGFRGYSRPAFLCKQCAAGRYGATSGLRSSACSGLCAEGHYCPAGSTAATAFPCGGPDYYCPEGSPRPIPAAAGRYTVSRSDIARNRTAFEQLTASSVSQAARVAEVLCSPGHYCRGGVSIPCPRGRYGNSTGLQTAACTAMCPDGSHCPAGSVLPSVCPLGYYCPDGETPVICPAGTFGMVQDLKGRQCSGYCREGYYCTAGSTTPTRALCPTGRYGAVAGLADSQCSGLCAAGYYCPAGSTSPRQRVCGDASVYCPAGSSVPTPVTKGLYTIGGTSDRTRTGQVVAEAGFYAISGVKWPCKAGTYGAEAGLSANFIDTFTPTPSRSPTQQPTARPTTQHPTAMPSAPIVSTSPSRSPTPSPTAAPSTFKPSVQPTRDPTARPTAAPSAPAALFPTSMPSVELLLTMYPTASPTAFEELPMTNFLCTGLCAPGYYCPRNTTKQLPCPAGRYGATAGLTTADCTTTCPLGHYCVAGSVAPVQCPPGLFGNSTGLTDSSCSTNCWAGGCNPTAQLCEAGYYCPQGSIIATQVQCGGPGFYCPRGSTSPTAVSPGHYSIGRGSSNIRNSADSSDRADTDDTEAFQTRIGQTICEEGHYCVGGIKRNCPPGVYGATKGLVTAACSGLCAAGHYCPEGSTNATTHRCPPGRYGSTQGLFDSSCSGRCMAGYHCDAASISATQLECAVLRRTGSFDATIAVPAKDLQSTGSQGADPATVRTDVYLSSFDTTTKRLPHTNVTVVEVTEPNSVYCPEGSSLPLRVRPGYYAVGSNRTTRSAQEPCPMGSYCVSGVIMDCPAGRYGRAERLTSPDCTGLCAKGHYCPAGSTTRTQYPCPIGRYGAEEGLGSPACSGACLHPLDCPIGSVIARPRQEL